jgi:energy-coupling factor transporter ATP-binding protein EcfA2
MALNNIESFTITPSKLIQLILGSNGSGKSSLLNELTPLPPDQNNYYKDGSKTIILINHGNNYILKSTFAPSVKHSFIKNDEELNPGGTVTVFKELVKQEFNITPEIHDLLVGNELFHSMSPARRREWFTMLSDTNYDYAINVYNKLKERSRDITGALKLAKKHIVTESAKIISEEEEMKLKHDVDLTHSELNLLIEQSAPLDKPISEYKDYQQTKLEELTNLSNKLLRIRLASPYGLDTYGYNSYGLVERDEWGSIVHQGFNSVEDIDSAIDKIKHSITGKEALINNAIFEHTKISDTIKILVKTGEEGIKTLHMRRHALISRIDDILALRKLKIDIIEPNNSLSALESIYEILQSIALSIPNNEDKRFSQAKLNELTELLSETKNKLNDKVVMINRLESQKVHLETHKNNGDIVCPMCKHTWIPGYSEEHLNILINDIIKTNNEKDELLKQINNLEDEITKIKEYGNLYKDYIRCIKNWPILQPFWDYINNENYIIRAPRKIVTILDIFKNDIIYEIDASKLRKELDEVNNLIKSAEEIGDANLNELQTRLVTYTENIELMTSELSKLQSNLNSHYQYKKQLIEALDLSDRIDKLVMHLEDTNSTIIEMIRRDTLNHCIRQLQSSLALKETTLNNAMLQKGIVTDLQKQIDKYTIEEEAAKTLVRQLSPTDGLIAEGLLGFIKIFVSQMNSLIKKLWSYPLIIKDCGITNTELDYRFPLIVNNTDNTVSDIRQGSTGMKEIVDLSFKVIAMKYLGLSESTLYLDEFGASLDKTHRSASIDLIKTLMETQNFTQLFMINHYENIYGAFTNMEICVLDDRNITVPARYNEHVLIS